MRILEKTEEGLRVTHDDSRWTLWFLAIGVVFLGFALFNYMKHPPDFEKVKGGLGAASIFILTFLAAFERSVFVFNGSRRMVEWTRRRAFSRRSGSVPFDDVQAVVAQSAMGDEGTPSRRIVLLTEGKELPLSVGYSTSKGNECLEMASELNRFVGRGTEDTLTDSLRGLVGAGRSLDAARLLREEKELSLGQAMGQVETMREGSGAPARKTLDVKPATFFWRPALVMRECSIIDRSVAEVWPFIVDAGHFKSWNPKVVSMDASGEFCLGQTFSTAYSMSRKHMQCLTTITALEPLRMLELHHTNCIGEKSVPGMDVLERISLKESGGKTRVRKWVRVKNHGIPWLFLPLIWFVSRFGSPAESDKLKGLCEKGPRVKD